MNDGAHHGSEAAARPAEATPDQPVRDAERLVTLDFIRGIAVLGIVFANITAFAQPYTAYFWPKALAQPMDAGDQAVWLFQFVFIDGKLRGLFTLLFGAGLYLFMERAWARGQGAWLQVRRLFFLLLFGLAHYFLLWRGDILTYYAVWGVIALALIDLPAESQFRLGVMFALAGALFNMAVMADTWFEATRYLPGDEVRRAYLESYPATLLAEAHAETQLYQGGSYADIIAYVIREEAGPFVRQIVQVGLTETFGLILIGMALYRRGLFSGGMDRARLMRWGWAGVLAGWLTSLLIGLWPYSEGFPFYTTLFAFSGLASVPQLVTALGLAALLGIWGEAASQGWLGQRLVAAGRMAFSNYIGTSVLMIFVFHGWALGLFGRLGRIELLALVIVVWALMLGWSAPWLARFRYGPLEWLWRCLTYGKFFKLRR